MESDDQWVTVEMEARLPAWVETLDEAAKAEIAGGLVESQAVAASQPTSLLPASGSLT